MGILKSNNKSLASRVSFLNSNPTKGFISYNFKSKYFLHKEKIKRTLKTEGFVYGNIGIKSDGSLIDIAKSIGQPMLETNPKTTMFTSDTFILNLECQVKSKTDYDLHPHTRSHILMHSESSASKICYQPNYVLFYCKGNQDPIGGVTYLKSNKSIINKLSEQSIKVLQSTFYKNYESEIPFVDNYNLNKISIRDHGQLDLHFKNETYEDSEVKNSIKELFHFIYDVQGLSAISWKKGDIIIFDNSMFLHARSKIEENAEVRTLQRIKIR